MRPASQPYYGPQSPSGAQSQITCQSCMTLLMFPATAANVRCARCGGITAVHPASSSPDLAQVTCSNPQCRIALMYPRGANQVQCSVCGTINCALAANQVGHIVCGQCSITLMYAHGAQSVKCAMCQHVTPVSAGTVTLGPQRTNTASTSTKPTQTVVVHNPPTIDENGNEVQSIAVGVTSLAHGAMSAAASGS